MINGFDINPLTHDLHLTELERIATETPTRPTSGKAGAARKPARVIQAILRWLSQFTVRRMPSKRPA